MGLVLFRELLYCDARVAKNDTRSKAERRAQAARQPGRTRRVVHLLLMLIASVIVVDTLVGERGLLAMLQARKQYDELTLTLARLRADNARLREETRRLRDDPAAIEEVARRELGLIKPGEKLFIIRDVPPASRSAPPATAAPRPAPPATR